MVSLPRYEKYKDSGVEWLGEIPEHWQIKKLKFLADQISNKIQLKEPNSSYLGLENIESWTGKKIETELVAEGTASIFQKNDILFGKLRPYLAKVYLAQNKGCCTTEALVLRFHDVNEKFYFYLLLSKLFINLVNSSVYGSKMPRASWDFIGSQIVPLPSIAEQKRIVEFLDRKCGEIEEAIAKKQRLIELLEEEKTILINQAVTKGYHKELVTESHREKPWLFKLPNNWKREKLKYNSYLKGRLGWQNLRSDEYQEEGPLLVSSEHFKNDQVEWHRCNHVKRERFEMAPEIILQEQDVLFMKDGASMGKIAYIDLLPEEACLNSHLLLMRPQKNKYLPKFLFYTLKTDMFNAYMSQERNGSTFFGFSQKSMGDFPITLPPLKEQEKIIDYLDQHLEELTKLRKLAEKSIQQLNELKQILIAEAVTGKIKV